MRIKPQSPPAPSPAVRTPPATPAPKWTINTPHHDPNHDQPETRKIRRWRFHLVGLASVVCIYMAWVLVIGPRYYGQPGVAIHSAPKIEKPLVIAVMGMTGVGKSTFIKELTKDANISIGHRLESCTDAIQYSSLSLQTETGITYNVILADTPGFDDSREDRSDAGILEDIADWLEGMYDADTKLTGILYLHRITDDRLVGSAVKNLRMMQSLVGEDNLKNVMLVTNRWEKVVGNSDDLSKAEAREHELLSNDNGQEGFWFHMTSTHGAAYSRHDGSYGSAKKILNLIVQNSPVFIKLQDELAKGIDILDTAAGAAVMSDMEKQSRIQAKRLARIEEEMKRGAEEHARRMKEIKENFDKEREKGEQAVEEAWRRMDQMQKEYDARTAETHDRYRKLKDKMMIQEEEMRRLMERVNRRGFFSKAGEKMDHVIAKTGEGVDHVIVKTGETMDHVIDIVGKKVFPQGSGNKGAEQRRQQGSDEL